MLTTLETMSRCNSFTFPMLLKAIAGSMLLFVFIFWTVYSFFKFIDEPTGTHITYSIGDDDEKGITFPQVTICNYDFTRQNPVLDKCRNGSYNFLPAMSNCFNSDPTFNLDEFKQSLELDPKVFIKSFYLQYGSTVAIPLDNLESIILSNVYHHRFGLCYNIDLEKSAKYQVSSYQGKTTRQKMRT